MKETLFTVSSRMIRDQAAQMFKKSGYDMIAKEVQRMKRNARTEARRMRAAFNAGRKPNPGRVIETFTGSKEFTRFLRDVRRYSRSGLRPLLQTLMDRIGPYGKLIQALIGYHPQKQRGTSQMLGAAVDLLRAFGYEVLPPPDSAVDEQDQERADKAARKWLERGKARPSMAKQRELQSEEPEEVPPRRVRPPGTSGSVVEVIDSTGRPRKFPATHPIATGKFVRTANSTNVYEFGYDYKDWELFVRFQDPTGGPGALYKYSQVPPELYLRLYTFRNAGDRTGTGMSYSSPGTFVWGQLRIRGTISGHRKDYALVGTAGTSLPRKATMTPQGEALVPRGPMLGPRGQVLTSDKPFQLVRPNNLTNRAEPRRGTPKRPNNGGPNRGR